MTTEQQGQPERIDINDSAAAAQWAKRLDCSVDQLHEAVNAVGDRLGDVEMHLKGSHSIANAERMKAAGGS